MSQKQALILVEIDTSTHFIMLENMLNSWLFCYYCENNCLTLVLENS